MPVFEGFNAVVTTAASAGFGAVAAPLLFGVPERRRARGDAQDALSRVEFTRYPDRSRTWHEFSESVHRLRATTLVARAPRELVNEYVFLARTGRIVSDAVRKTPAEPGEGSYRSLLRPEHSECIRDAADLLADALWHPITSRFGRARKLAALRAKVEGVRHLPGITGETMNRLWRGRTPLGSGRGGNRAVLSDGGID